MAIDPLRVNIPIADEKGFPSTQFLRQWNQQIATDGSVISLLTKELIAGVGLAGGGVLGAPGNITFALDDTAVTPGTYGDATHVAQFTVDQQGRITGVVDVPISGSGGVDVEDEGTPVATATTLNFVGAGVTATDAGGGVVDVTIPGGSGGVDVEDEGTPVATATTLNFVGAGVTATDAGGGVVDVTVPGASNPFFDPPAAADFPTAYTNGTVTLNEFADISDEGLSMAGSLTSSSPGSLLRMKSVSDLATNALTVTVGLTWGYQVNVLPQVGIALRRASNGNMVWFGPILPARNGLSQMRRVQINGVTVNAQTSLTGPWPDPRMFLRLVADGAGNLTFYISSDGHTYHLVHATTTAAYIVVADELGFFLAKYSNNTTVETVSMMIFYYDEF